MSDERVLNVPLFNALCEICDGDVRITNEGQEGYIETTSKGGKLFATRSRDCEQYMINCPDCGDTRHRLYISHWAFKKVMRGKKRVMTNSLFYCQNEPTKCKHTTLRSKIRSIIKEDSTTTQKLPPNRRRKKVVDMGLPEGCVPVNAPEAPLAVQDYLRGRGFDLDELYNGWGVRACEYLMEYPGNGPKIIYPVLSNGNMMFWQARLAWDPTKEQQRSGVRKYYFPTGSNKSDVVYNKDNARKHPVVVIMEGVTDAQRLGESGVCIFGKVPSTRQTQIFQNAMSHNMGVMLLDEDAGAEAKAYYAKYKEHIFPRGFFLVTLDSGDPASYSREELWSIIVKKIGEQT